jgi:hypothetical protein
MFPDRTLGFNATKKQGLQMMKRQSTVLQEYLIVNKEPQTNSVPWSRQPREKPSTFRTLQLGCNRNLLHSA